MPGQHDNSDVHVDPTLCADDENQKQRAAKLLQSENSVRTVASVIGTSKSTVHRWKKMNNTIS